MRARRLPLVQNGAPFRGIRHYMRARMHRRLFWSMGLATLSMLAAAFAILHLTADGHAPAERKQALLHFASERFAEVWARPAERDRLAEQAAQAFGVRLELRSTEGTPIHRAGGVCERPWLTVPITTAGESRALGSVEVCGGSGLGPESWRLMAALGAAALALWVVSGFIAHRLGRPLWQLTQVTEQIGKGDLSARARLGRHHGGEVGVLAHSVNTMAERIEGQLRDQKELLAGVSHEMRTPLARLRLLTELLRAEVGEGRLLQDIDREVEEIDDLTGQLLASSRLDFQSLTMRPQNLVDLAIEQLRRAGLSPELLEVESSDPILEGDPTLLGRALQNLIRNATLHGRGLVRLHLTEKDSFLVLTAEDSGPGFAEDEIKKVFAPFVRGGPTERQGETGSLGLGLSLVDRIARAHGGRASAMNRPSGGAAVSLWLPFRPRARSVVPA